jgi:hypothetical protein
MIFVLARLFRPYPGYSKVIHHKLKTCYPFSSQIRAELRRKRITTIKLELASQYCDHEKLFFSACRLADRQIHIVMPNEVAAKMVSNIHAGSKKSVAPGRHCQFRLADLIRVDFVFPYGRVAANGNGLQPEPFDRDAEFAIDQKDIEQMRKRIASLFGV